ncbi:unnamed protein product [Leuciscus chuanchicus]
MTSVSAEVTVRGQRSDLLRSLSEVRPAEVTVRGQRSDLLMSLSEVTPADVTVRGQMSDLLRSLSEVTPAEVTVRGLLVFRQKLFSFSVRSLRLSSVPIRRDQLISNKLSHNVRDIKMSQRKGRPYTQTTLEVESHAAAAAEKSEGAKASGAAGLTEEGPISLGVPS